MNVKQYMKFIDALDIKILLTLSASSENKLEEVDGVVVEETLVDWEAQVPQVHHFGGSNIDVVNLDLALTTGSHSEFVKDLCGGFIDTEDHDFVDDLSLGLRVHVLVADRLCDGDLCAVVVVTHLCSLVVPVVVVLTVVEVEVAAGLGVLAHRVGVDLETDRVLDGLKERLSAIREVQHGQDGAAAHEGALLGVADVDDVDVVVGVDLELGVDVVPLRGGGKVNFDLGGAAGNGVLGARVADLR